MLKNKINPCLFLVVITILCGILGACTEKRRKPNGDEQALLKTLIRTDSAKPSHPLDIQFENKLKLIGYDVSQDRAEPGDTVKITWYWQPIAPIKSGWAVFTHITDANDGFMLNADNEGLIRQVLPPSEWKQGQTILDPQKVTIPSDWTSPEMKFKLGVWRRDLRLRIVKGEHDEESRATGLVLPVSIATPTLPDLEASAAKIAPKIDGVLDDAVWKTAPHSPEFVQTMTGAPGEPKATVQVAWDKTSLYIAFDIKDTFLKSKFTQHDEHLWEQDVAEIMVDPDGDGTNYFELQASPNGITFDTRYDMRRVPQPYGHMDWESKATVGVKTKGQVNDTDTDEGYIVEWAIPWTAFAAGDKPATPPKMGDAWRLNFYVLDALQKGEQASAWSPPKVGDFHVPARFGKVVFR